MSEQRTKADERDELKQAVKRCADCSDEMTALRHYLIGNPHIPGDDGAIQRIENHLVKANGRIGKCEDRMNKFDACMIKMETENKYFLLTQFTALPRLIKVLLVLWVISSVASMGAGVDYLSKYL